MMFLTVCVAVLVGHLFGHLINETMLRPYFAARRIRARLAEQRRFFMQFGDVDWDEKTPTWTSAPMPPWQGRLN